VAEVSLTRRLTVLDVDNPIPAKPEFGSSRPLTSLNSRARFSIPELGPPSAGICLRFLPFSSGQHGPMSYRRAECRAFFSPPDSSSDRSIFYPFLCGRHPSIVALPRLPPSAGLRTQGTVADPTLFTGGARVFRIFRVQLLHTNAPILRARSAGHDGRAWTPLYPFATGCCHLLRATVFPMPFLQLPLSPRHRRCNLFVPSKIPIPPGAQGN